MANDTITASVSASARRAATRAAHATRARRRGAGEANAGRQATASTARTARAPSTRSGAFAGVERYSAVTKCRPGGSVTARMPGDSMKVSVCAPSTRTTQFG